MRITGNLERKNEDKSDDCVEECQSYESGTAGTPRSCLKIKKIPLHRFNPQEMEQDVKDSTFKLLRRSGFFNDTVVTVTVTHWP